QDGDAAGGIEHAECEAIERQRLEIPQSLHQRLGDVARRDGTHHRIDFARYGHRLPPHSSARSVAALDLLQGMLARSRATCTCELIAGVYRERSTDTAPIGALKGSAVWPHTLDMTAFTPAMAPRSACTDARSCGRAPAA